MCERIFKGIYGIVLTPFKENGKVDYETLANQVEEISKSKALTGLAVCGSTGEFTRLSFEENTNLMKTVKEASPKDKKIICGATSGDSYTANKYVEFASKIGADGILIAPPYYFKLSNEEIFEYYADVMKNNSSHLPIVGYNIPQCTNGVTTANFEKLLEFDDFKGFKNSWNDMQEITAEIALRDEKRPDVSMLTGLDACLYGTLALGGDGIFSAITYLMPEIINVIFEGGENAFKCQCELIKLINIVNRFTFPYGYRVLSDALGFCLGEGREKIPQKIYESAKSSMIEMHIIYDNMMKKYVK